MYKLATFVCVCVCNSKLIWQTSHTDQILHTDQKTAQTKSWLLDKAILVTASVAQTVCSMSQSVSPSVTTGNAGYKRRHFKTGFYRLNYSIPHGGYGSQQNTLVQLEQQKQNKRRHFIMLRFFLAYIPLVLLSEPPTTTRGSGDDLLLLQG